MNVKKIFLLVFWMQWMMIGFAQMTDEQVVALLKQARDEGKSQQEMVIMLSQRGVTQEQLMRIKNEYAKSGVSGTSNTLAGQNRMREELLGSETMDSMGFRVSESMQGIQQPVKTEGLVFGRDIFRNRRLTFEPNLNIPTPENYVLGPGDEVIIDIWGNTVRNIRQEITPDGNITIDEIGPVYLNGLKIEEAYIRVKNALANVYASLNSDQPNTFLKLSLGKVRSIRVNVMGEVALPGTYTLPSLATLFHALYNAGGVGSIGSLRHVRVNRNGKEIANVDIYDYLLKGKSDLDISLNDGDVIIVSPYENMVTLTGNVKRPMIYELKGTETLSELLNYAGGFTGDAFKESIRVIRKSGREYQVFNVDEPEYASFVLMDGDAVSVDAMLSRFENKVEVRGAVFRPGLYALGEEVSTVGQLLNKAEGLTEDAFVNRAVMYREKPDLTREVVAVDIAGILNGLVEDIPLHKNDELYIPSIFDLREEYTIGVYGEVGKPGVYKYVDNMTLEDLVIQAGGLKESASTAKIDVARRVKNPQKTTPETKLAENYTFTLKDGLLIDGNTDFVLEPFDEVFVRTSPGYQYQQTVSVSGEVLFGGSYVLSQKGQRLSELVKQAGGLMPEAYVSGARLIRKMNAEEQARVQSVLKLAQQGDQDSIALNTLDIGNHYYVGIELDKALAYPGSEYDIVLREGDQLIVPEYTGTVKITGGVMYPNTVVYRKGAGLKYYIDQAGGFASNAKKRKVFIVYMNGTVEKSRIFAKAQASPGCEIIVPVKPQRRKTGLAEIMSLATSTTSMAALITSIINNTK